MAKVKPILIFSSIGYGIVSFVVAFILGSALTVTTGIPLVGGLLNGILTAMVLTIGLITTQFFGAATIMWITFSLLASITTTLGPPGLYKILIGIIAGLIWDTLYNIFNKNRIGLYLGGLIGSASIMLTLVLALKMGLGRNAVEALSKYESAFYILIIINLIVTLIGIYLGELTYKNRLSNLQVIRNIRRHVK